MQLSKHFFAPLRVLIVASLLLLGETANIAYSQTYDISDWYGDQEGYYDDYDDITDYFYDESVYNPYGDDDNYYDPGYNSRYFPRDYSRFEGYTAFGPNLGPNFYGGDRYYGPHFRYDGYGGLYEYPYGYNNYYYNDNGLGADYFTNDWYDDTGTFDDWY